MIIPSAARMRNIENFSAIQNRGVARTLLKSMQEIAAHGSVFSARGLPVLKFNPEQQDIDCRILATPYEHWQASRVGEDLPTVDYIQPDALRPALGWFVLADLVDDGDDLVYRLFGSEIAWRFELDLTGQRVSDTPAPIGPFLAATFLACVAARGPLLAQCAFHDAVANRIHCLLLPWADATGAVTRVMAVVSVRDHEQSRPSAPLSTLVRFKDRQAQVRRV